MASEKNVAAVKVAQTSTRKDSLRVPKLGHVVADRLRQRIASGEIASGDRLPSESQMLTDLGVSRPTLREALRVLESEGLISVGRGMRMGATVLGPSISRVAQFANLMLVSSQATLSNIQEVRLLLEPPNAAALARRANRKPIVDSLRKVLHRGAGALQAGDYHEAIAANHEFHELLLRSTDNPVLLLVIGMLHDFSVKTYDSVLMGDNTADNDALRRNIGKSIEGARILTDHIAEGKAEEAEMFWRTYMERTLLFLGKTKLGARRVRYESVGT